MVTQRAPLRVLFIFGTRPEAIKLAPLIRAFRQAPAHFRTTVCVTAQHRQMLDQVLGFFKITPDVDLGLMRPHQALPELSSRTLQQLARVTQTVRPQLIVVQGDTTSTFMGALAGYYCKVKVAHVEAGLRTGDRYSPFPEEMNRILTDHLADLHFVPTPSCREALSQEGIRRNVWVVGNTVIDALRYALGHIRTHPHAYGRAFSFLGRRQKMILVTGHRRESFGAPFEQLCVALKVVAGAHPELALVYPVHLNPQVRGPVHRILSGIKNVHLIEPQAYPFFVWLMRRACLIMTDSGGVQEEAPYLGRPVLVMRRHTERREAVAAGCAQLVGTDTLRIVRAVNRLLASRQEYRRMCRPRRLYGDGRASERIVRIVKGLCTKKF